MSNRLRQVKCCKCGHTWYVDLDELDKKDQVVYRGKQPKTYRVKCPQCHTNNVFTVQEE
ncbi:MAG: hypothetical protein SXV54_11350 [Chloroflexota bacterium]|nr:hypothetical protein [Chloroflexota bacterium]